MIQNYDNKEEFSFSSEFSPSGSNKKGYPKISIITPSYNQGQFIEETIRSVVYQDYPNIEYIIIDGGSKDESVDIICKYKNQISHWVSESDNGQTDAINKGLKLATGDIIAYLNSDDVYYPNTFLKIARYFEQNPDIAMVYGNAVHIDRDGKLLSVIHTGKLDITQYLSNRFYLPQPSIFFRSCVLSETGYFDSRYHLAMDKEYWTRILVHFQVGYLPEILARVRIYDEAKSNSQHYKYLAEHLMILDMIFSNAALFQKQISISSNFEKFKREAYSSVYFQGGLAYLEIRQFMPAIHNILRAIRMNPFYLFKMDLCRSSFVAIFGVRLSRMIGKTLNTYRNRRDPQFNKINRESESNRDFSDAHIL
jgi:glycosyltransferase involved in cell wall biosynthesis